MLLHLPFVMAWETSTQANHGNEGDWSGWNNNTTQNVNDDWDKAGEISHILTLLADKQNVFSSLPRALTWTENRRTGQLRQRQRQRQR